ncbi:phage baseplate assembly protein V [Aeromonas hydrophila]|uniref:phage baseplate assembly protein V n=1 Tax=Aeromonas hydrophila TaxID=644 RepID=UPI001655989B|nr:phage baseplate assembly protein V [Aeromonas hydrophila]MBC8670801.1 phage baseplate assembly protein V [Aeromonas hydrophila]MBC8686547.1 phage baseplate assembly protein V [Aeromonas hydrophila]
MVSIRDVQKLLAPLQRRLRLIADRGIVTRVDDSRNRQNLQIKILADEVADDVERFQNYGHTSVPPDGSENIVLGIGGARAGLVAIAVEHKGSRPKGLEEGDSCLYHLEGHTIILRNDGVIELTAKTVIINATEKLTIISPDTEIQGPLHVTGKITSDTDVMTGSTSLKGHKHNQSGGGQTSAPV